MRHIGRRASAEAGATLPAPLSAMPPATVRPSSRDIRLDVLRGIFIVSMVFGHLAFGSGLARAIHPFRWVDGAFGFVFLSGLVLSLTRRRQIQRGDVGDAHAWVARRTLALWLTSSALIVGALALKVASHSPAFLWPTVGDAGDVVDRVPGVLGLETQPDYLDILPLYVVLLVLAQPALWLLRTRGPLALLGVSLVVYAAAVLGLLDHVPADSATLRWPAWQLLFLGGMVVGWSWPSVDGWLRRHRRVVTAAAAAPVLVLFLAAHDRLPWLADSFNKEELSPTTVIAGLGVLVCLLTVVGVILSTPLRSAFGTIAVVGRHSRTCFITLTVIHIAWLTIGHPASLAGSTRLSVATGALVACVAVAWVADLRRSAWDPRQRPAVVLDAAA